MFLRRNKINSFTKEILDSVDQEKWRDELYVLRHSYAARALFAKAQCYMALEDEADDDHATELFDFAMELFRAIGEIACEVAHRHPFAYHRWNPRRKWVPGVGKFMRLAKEIGFEKKQNEYGESYVKTIDGWWMV